MRFVNVPLRWSPEQIAGRFKFDKEPFNISYTTIYREIDSGVFHISLRKLYVLNGNTRNAKVRIKVVKCPILHRLLSALRANNLSRFASKTKACIAYYAELWYNEK